MRVPDEFIRLVMVTSTSLPFARLVIFALPPIGIALWAAVKPSSSISCVAIPRWVIGVLCAIQRPVVKNNPSMASITRLILCLLPPLANFRYKIRPTFNYYTYKKKYKIFRNFLEKK
jgi:hypothetical protein